MKLLRTLIAVSVIVPALATSAAAQDDRLANAVSNLEWRNVGPAIMGGRVADLAVVESNPSIFYVAAATGGLWRTNNAGTTFEPLFDDQATSSLGDVTLAPSNPNVVWVGSGEPQNRQSSPWGNGVYRSTDGGRTWSHLGLENTHHISRIVVHPNNPDVAYVAAMGHLWGPNPERGIYKTTDGGATWEQVLFVNEYTGAIDLIMDPGDPQTVLAAMYQRQRTGFGYNGGGPGSGIYRTLDGGSNWVELTEGLPEGDKGRIGLDVYRRDGNVIFALVQADVRSGGFGGAPPPNAQDGVYRSTDRGDTWEHMSTTNNRPMYYSQIRVDPNDQERIYLGGSSMYKSSDGGRTFTADASRGVHSDHHAIWIDPGNSDHVVIAGDGGISVSWDRTDNWRQLRNITLAQFYEIGADMRDPYHVCGGLQDNGSWCAPSNTLSNQGIRNRDWYNVGSGDGFYTLLDPTDHTIVYNESQGGNMTRVDLKTMERTRLRPTPRPGEDGETANYRFNWDAPMLISAHDPATIYLGGNHLHKSTDRGQTWAEISPDLTKAIDRAELEIMGAGEDQMLSRHDGTSSYGNLTSVGESPLNPNLIYTGADDGELHVTLDGGATWTNITNKVPNLPERTYVTRLVPSRFDEGTVYATFDGHRNDDFAAYVYVSEDYGQRWRSVTDGLPNGWSVNAFAEHPRTANLLFVGNEIGLYVSIDRAGSWTRIKGALPTVPVDDILIHPRENDLILGTHGRGIWISPDIGPLEQLSNAVLASDVHLFPVRRATSYNRYTPQGWTPGVYALDNPSDGALIRYYLGRDLTADVMATETDESNGGPNEGAMRQRGRQNNGAQVTINVMDNSGNTIRTLTGSGTAGIQEVVWDLRIEPPYTVERGAQQGGGGGGFRGGPPRGPRVLPGTYTVQLEAVGQTQTTDVEVRLDPRANISRTDLMARQETMMSSYALAKPAYEAGRAVRRLRTQLDEVTQLLKDQDDAPEALVALADSLSSRVDTLGQDINRASGGSRASNGIESSTTPPTADQVWQIQQSWEDLPGLIEQLNEIITVDMPALYDQLDQQGIRPDPGETVPIPRSR